MGLALVGVGRGGRFDPLAWRALGFTRRAGRKGQFELAILIARFVPLIPSRFGHLPAPDYLPLHTVWAFIRAAARSLVRGNVPGDWPRASDYYARC
jgi:hypothetical protein